MNVENMLDSLRAAQILSDKLIEEIIEIKNEYVKVHELKSFAHFITILSNPLVKRVMYSIF